MANSVAKIGDRVKCYAGEPRGAGARARFYDHLMRSNVSVVGGRGGPPTKLDFGAVVEMFLQSNTGTADTPPSAGRGLVRRPWAASAQALALPETKAEINHERN